MTKQELAEIVLPALLRPIARLCLKHAVAMRVLVYSAKIAMILAARDELERRGEKPTVSRVSLLTGLRRVEIPKLLAKESHPPLERPSVLSRIVGLWESGTDYVDEKGEPKELSVGGEESEFYRLSWSVSQNLHPASVLGELQRLNLVTVTAEKARLTRTAVVPVKGAAGAYGLMADDFSDLARTIDSFIDPNATPPYDAHIRTVYDNIYASRVPEIRVWIAKENARFHARLRKYLSARDKDSGPQRNEEAGWRFVVSSFSNSVRSVLTRG